MYLFTSWCDELKSQDVKLKEPNILSPDEKNISIEIEKLLIMQKTLRKNFTFI